VGNIAVAFLEATLYSDAGVCYERAGRDGRQDRDSDLSATLRTRALHGLASCGLYLHEYLRGVTACEEAIALLKEPRIGNRSSCAHSSSDDGAADACPEPNRRAAAHALLPATWRSDQAQCERRFRPQPSADWLRSTGEYRRRHLRIVSVRDQSKILAPAYQDALRASVSAYERAASPIARSP